MRVEIVSFIAELLNKVNCAMLEPNDRTIHLEQVAEVFKKVNGKSVFIDKPISATLARAVAIFPYRSSSIVVEKETLEILTFVESTNVSMRQNGAIILMEDVYRQVVKDAQELLLKLK